MKPPQYMTGPDATALLHIIDIICAHGNFILGPEVDNLERVAAQIVGTRYAIGCNSGFGAHLLTCLALEIEAGIHVAVPAYAPYSYVCVLERRGAKPVLVDSIAGGFAMDPVQLREIVAADRAAAVVVHHPFGSIADMPRVLTAASDLPVVEVATSALAISCEGGRMTGSFGVAATACLLAEGSIGAFGDAGMIWTDNKELAARIREIRSENSLSGLYQGHPCGNFHQDSLQAGIALNRLDSWQRSIVPTTEAVQELGGRLEACCIEQIVVPPIGEQRYPYLVVLAQKRDALREILIAAGIKAKACWTLPIHLQPGFRHLGHKSGEYPNAEHAAECNLHLPAFGTEADQEALVTVIQHFYATDE